VTRDTLPADLLVIALLAAGCSLPVAVVGWLLPRLLRDRSVSFAVTAPVLVAVLSVLAGVTGTALAMFLSGHDLRVLLVVLGIATALSLPNALLLGRRLAGQAVREMRERERERQAEASRRQVVAWVSHDLRTPLAGMRAMAEALEDGVVADPETVRAYHRQLRIEADRMTALVDDLFELSRIQAGALTLTCSPLSLSDVLSDALAASAPLAAAKGVRLVAEETELPPVLGSEPELSRVVRNLLANAIRYTPPDGAVVVAGGRDEQGAWFAVEDECGGIPREDLGRVFDVAFRGEQARTPDAASTGAHDGGGGLGLAIARGLVEAHRGAIAVHNRGPGCRFVVHLPTTP